MRIEDKNYLDFSDVLIIPKRSTLKSRSEVDITREYNFLYSPIKFIGTGIIGANMDGVGEFKVASVMANNRCMTALHKHHSVEDLSEFYLSLSPTKYEHIFYSIGITGDDQMKLSQVRRLISLVDPNKVPNKIVIDVANGSMERFVEFVKQFRDNNPTVVIMAGNVVTPEVTEQLILAGADIVKCGVGSGAQCLTRIISGVGMPQFSCIEVCADAAHGLGGQICSDGGCVYPGDVSKAFCAGCFTPKMEVKTTKGNKKISDVEIGDTVYTHKFREQQVKRKYEYDYKGSMISINSIISTPNHEYYVILKTDKELVTENNIHEYAKWIPAKDLDNKYLLVEH